MSGIRDRIAALTPEQRLRIEERLRRPQAGTNKVSPRPPEAEPWLSFGRERLWRLAQRMGGSAADYNVHTSYRIRGPLDVARDDGTFEDVVSRHGALRVTFAPENDIPWPESGPISISPSPI